MAAYDQGFEAQVTWDIAFVTQQTLPSGVTIGCAHAKTPGAGTAKGTH